MPTNNSIFCNEKYAAFNCEHEKETNISLVTTYSIVMIIGVIGNAIVIHKFITPERRRMAGSTMITTLAVNDLLASIFIPLYQTNQLIEQRNERFAWYLGEVLCIFLPGIQIVSIVASPWILVVISLERLR